MHGHMNVKFVSLFYFVNCLLIQGLEWSEDRRFLNDALEKAWNEMYCGLIDILCRYLSVKMKEKTVTIRFALAHIGLGTCRI